MLFYNSLMKTWKQYEKWSDLKTQYGAVFSNAKWNVTLWHPFALNVNLIIYDKNDQNKIYKMIKGSFQKPNWKWKIKEDLDGFFYHYEITQENGKTNKALDPFAKSMASFNWQGHEKNVGKAAFIKLKKTKVLTKLQDISKPHPIIYEANIRDLTSLRKDVKKPGSFNAIIEAKIGNHLNKLNFTHVQFLPIHSCYTLNENDKNIIQKGDGKGWITNYNWGYDPHNYFSINGWYSSNANDPYKRINEFKQVVKHFHQNNIFIINDVVYNHIYDNSILNNVIPNYYFRNEATEFPVNQAPLASERKMVQRIIIESLKWFVEFFDVDGFRFDLSTFIDKTTLDLICKELRQIKPNLVLHGEAWNWTDLDEKNSYNKGIVDNQNDFAYFNDTTRNAIKGVDDSDGFSNGLLLGNKKEYPKYLSSIIGNLKSFTNAPRDISVLKYDRFTSNINNVLNYSACHDGHTLWDKINLTVKSSDFNEKLEYYRQALMMQTFLPGRTLYLQGTELLYTKPSDNSGQDKERFHQTQNVLDIFKLGNKYHENTYKTTDWSNGVRWSQLENKEIKKHIFDFFQNLNYFRKHTPFFNLQTSKQVDQSITFNYANIDNLIIDFNVLSETKKIRIIHNFSNKNYKYESEGKIIFDNKINKKSQIGISLSHSSIVIET